MNNIPARQERKISCKRCQKRKIRCSRTYPCINCTDAGAACEFREDDSKRYPVSREYTSALERRVASLESVLKKLKHASSAEREVILDALSFDTHLETAEDSLGLLGAKEPSTIGVANKSSLQDTKNGSLIYHGPTSFYDGEFSTALQEIQPRSELQTPSTQEISTVGPAVSRCIALFFRWQYPQFMFVPREAFIRDYLKRSTSTEFCSPALIYSICAIGALLSSDAEVKNASARFQSSAVEIVMSRGLAIPHSTSVQALLCLAFLEIGKGNLSKGWQYSGMAFRMGQDLGFQRDPKNLLAEHTQESSYESEVRRRIYWGCYMSDKLISLFLGRPTLMQGDDSDVNTSEPLPRHLYYQDWLRGEGLVDYIEPITSLKLTLVFNRQIELGRLMQDMLSRMFAPKKLSTLEATRSLELSLMELNSRLSTWHEALPGEMRWKKWPARGEKLQQHIAVLHMLYHSTIISLNRPFLKPLTNSARLESPSESQTTCDAAVESIIEILQRFRTDYTLRNSPFVFVQGTILALNARLITTRNQHAWPVMTDSGLSFLDLALEDLSHVWELAGEARRKFWTVLRLRQNKRPELSASGEHERADDRKSDTPAEARFANTEDADVPMLSGGMENSSTLCDDSVSATQGAEQYIWDPLTWMDEEAAYWSTLENTYLIYPEDQYIP
ncbi:hypothetical protein BP6252_01876 [Coleophoma cylindrospora]|uniref:Zn(2)-C6 fungal-type domain-containing protein n=1 Tax=Coleophoma cylindrospora TaxID=1849047 RepID=A0A3D8SD73_9HELO|nr:hypothetical protein BP6252_01876 [Coleophoma cylindrospora]